MSSNIFNLTANNLQTDLLEPSKNTLFIIDFWADWCEPCKQLMPVLEKIASELVGQVVLAKVNCDEQQELAMQFGIKSLPTVMLFKDGQPIDGFAGVQSESEIRALLEKHLPKPEHALFEQAIAAHQSGDKLAAYPLIKQAIEFDSENKDFKILLADICVDLGKMEEAKQLLSLFKLADQNAQYHHVVAKLELAEQAADTPEIQALQNSLEESPEDLTIMCQLAIAYHSVKRHDDALELLLKVLKKDLGFADAKKTYLDIIASLPEGDELATKYRRQLYTLLY